MKTLMDRALNLARLRGAQYADIRVVHDRSESMVVKNDVVESLNSDETIGFGVRVLADGGWGFASSRELTRGEVDRVTALALEIAWASALANRAMQAAPVELGPEVKSQGIYHTPFLIDPFKVSLGEKLDLLLKTNVEMARVEGVRVRRGNLTLFDRAVIASNSTAQALFFLAETVIAKERSDALYRQRLKQSHCSGGDCFASLAVTVS
jgi:TldD protein